MRAKKPILLIVLVVALLAVAFTVPAVAYAKQDKAAYDNKPVSWVSHGENSNNTLFKAPEGWIPEGDEEWVPWQGGHSILIKELADGSIVGHGTLIMVRPEKAVMRAHALLDHDPFTGDPIDVFRVDGDYRVAEVIMDFGDDPSLPFRYFKVVLCDGGGPKTTDWESNWVGVPGLGWILFGQDPPFSNIQVHLGDGE